MICFHNPDEENGYLSNWYLSDFIVDNIKYSSMEQYMMYKKAVCFADTEIAYKILETSSVVEIKTLGRQVSGYNENIWNGMRQIIVYETKDAILAECAAKDRIWEIGLSMNDPKRLDMNQWKGQNLLGYTLMMVREKS